MGGDQMKYQEFWLKPFGESPFSKAEDWAGWIGSLYQKLSAPDRNLRCLFDQQEKNLSSQLNTWISCPSVEKCQLRIRLCDYQDRNKDRKRTSSSPELWDTPQPTLSSRVTQAPYREK